MVGTASSLRATPRSQLERWKTENMTEPEAAADEAVAKELIELRQRGLANIDVQTTAQPRKSLPLLEGMARQYTQDSSGRRIELIRRLLYDALLAWRELGYQDEAQLVGSLLFDDGVGVAVGRKSAGELLAAASRPSGVGDAAFDKRRRDVFRKFAAFMRTLPVPAGLAAPAETPAAELIEQLQPPSTTALTSHRTRSRSRLLGLGLLIAVVAAVFWLVGSSAFRSTKASAGSSTGPVPVGSSTAATGTATEAPLLTFDDLGGGSSIMEVYPGIKDDPQDRLPNGTFRAGEFTRALCKATGRTVSSDTGVGERPRQSDMWIQIVGSPGVKQYAPLTYAEVSAAVLQALPVCADAH